MNNSLFDRRRNVAPGEMLSILEEVTPNLPKLLEEPGAWQSLDISDTAPKAERLWRQVGDMRVYLHRIFPCNPADVLYHNYPWPLAMSIISGQYEMGMGYTNNKKEPHITSSFMLSEGAKYEIIDQNIWHYIRPLKMECYTIMVSGQPWDSYKAPEESNLTPLSQDRFSSLYSKFQRFFL